jgi:hypothetical protein
MPKTNYYSFGNSASRDAYDKVYTPGDQPSPRGRDMKDMPGPGEYKYKNMNVGVDARKFSFLKRTKNVYEPENIMKKGNVPGPGSYAPVIEINSIGKYHLSTTPNSRAANWSPSRNRFPDHTRRFKHIPGPGTYNPSHV